MSSLTQLFPIANFLTGAAAGNFTTIYVYNTNIDSVSNGGSCCLFTVPSGTSWIRFELWGGGSAGPGACCCQQPVQSGGAGAYARKTVAATAGNTYTVCAAGSTARMPTCCGTEGSPSFAPLSHEVILKVVDKFLMQLEDQLHEKKVDATFKIGRAHV